jgi:hypothetical protein
LGLFFILDDKEPNNQGLPLFLNILIKNLRATSSNALWPCFYPSSAEPCFGQWVLKASAQFLMVCSAKIG